MLPKLVASAAGLEKSQEKKNLGEKKKYGNVAHNPSTEEGRGRGSQVQVLLGQLTKTLF